MAAGRLASLAISAVLAVLLLILLVVSAGVDVAAAERLMRGFRPGAFAAIVLFVALNNFLAGEKWRLVVLRLPPDVGRDMPRPFYFALSAIGAALGQLLPVQVTTALCRWLGARAYGASVLGHGIGATLFEQAFDAAVAGLLSLASLFVILVGGGAAAWFVAAVGALLAGLALCGLGARLLAALGRRLAPRFAAGGRIAGLAAGSSALLEPGLARCLYLLSTARFAVLALVAIATAEAVGIEIPFWQLAAAFPLGVFVSVLALTPGGIGVAEWALASALVAFGTKLAPAAEWAIACRVLVILAAALCAAIGLVIVGATRRSRSRRDLGEGGRPVGDRRV